MAASVTWVQLLEYGTGRPMGEPRPMHRRRAAGLLSRGRAVVVDAPADDGGATSDDEPDVELPVPGESTVAELLDAVRSGLLDAEVVLAAERDRPRPRTTILDRLGG